MNRAELVTALTSETLYDAADLLERRGWGQGAFGWLADGDGPLCVEGALSAAVGIDLTTDLQFYRCPAYEAVTAYLGRDPQPRTAPIKDALWQWNDEAGRTAAEVVAVLRAAAAICEARESAPELTPAAVLVGSGA